MVPYYFEEIEEVLRSRLQTTSWNTWTNYSWIHHIENTILCVIIDPMMPTLGAVHGGQSARVQRTNVSLAPGVTELNEVDPAL